MSAARTIAAISAFGACALYGAVRKARTKGEAAALGGITEDLMEAERMVRLTRSPLTSIAGELAKAGKSQLFWRSIHEKMLAGSSLFKAYSSTPKPCMNGEAGQVLDGLFSSLGRGDAETESKRIRLAAERLGALFSETEKRASEKCRLTSSLSVLAGAAAALLLI